MEPTKERPPLAPELPTELETGADLQNAAEEAATAQQDVMGLRFVESSLGGVAGVCLEFSACVFERCAFRENDVKRVSFVDCVLDHCDLSNMRFDRATFQRVRFQNCRMTGVSFGDAALMNALFQSCAMDYASFSDTKLDRVCLAENRMRESVWASVAMSHVAWVKNDLTRAQWHRTPLKGMDMRTCEVEAWAIDTGDLRGVRVTPLQALELSRLLGLVIED